MTNNESQDLTKKIYDQISYQRRKKLLHLISQQKWTIKGAATYLGIKLCTAKYILYKFRRDGKISQKKADAKKQKQSNQDQNVGQEQKYNEYSLYLCSLSYLYLLPQSRFAYTHQFVVQVLTQLAIPWLILFSQIKMINQNINQTIIYIMHTRIVIFCNLFDLIFSNFWISQLYIICFYKINTKYFLLIYYFPIHINTIYITIKQSYVSIKFNYRQQTQ